MSALVTLSPQNLLETGLHPFQILWPPTATSVILTVGPMDASDLLDTGLSLGMGIKISEDGWNTSTVAGDPSVVGWTGGPSNPDAGPNIPVMQFSPGVPPTVNGTQVTRSMEATINLMTKAASVGLTAQFLP